MIDRVFDYVARFDERSKQFSVRSIIDESNLPERKMWDMGPVLNQGGLDGCVGFSWTGYLLGSPNQPSPQTNSKYGTEFAKSIYFDIKDNDFVDGRDYYGTNIIAGAFRMQDRGFIEKYYWCFNTDDVRDAVLSIGPVIAGIKWYASMTVPDEHGLMPVKQTKAKGRHAILVTGYDPAMQFGDKTYEVFRIRNSWGDRWAKGGDAYIKVSDFAKVSLLSEMCVPYGKTPPVFNKYTGMIAAKEFQPEEKPNLVRIGIVYFISQIAGFFLKLFKKK